MDQPTGNVACSFLSLLPTAIQTDILCRWLKLEEICKFDSASCESTLRRSYLQCVRSKQAVLNYYYDIKFGTDQGCIEWVIMRGIMFSKIVLPAKLIDNRALSQRFFIHAGRLIEHLDTSTPTYPMYAVDGSLPRRPVMEDVASYCPNIKRMKQSRNLVDAALCPLFEKCTKLQSVTFKDDYVIGCDVLSTICRSALQLVTLRFHSCSFCGDFVPSGGTCLSVRNLDIRYSNLPGELLVRMARLFPNATCINMDNMFSSDLQRIAQACPQLTSFNTEILDELHDAHVLAFTSFCKDIDHLSIIHVAESDITTLASESSVLHILRHCTKLITLDLCCYPPGHCYDDNSDIKLVQELTAPSQLRIFSVDCLSPEAFAFVVQHCPLLQTLSVMQSENGRAFPAELVARSRIPAFVLEDSRLLTVGTTSEMFTNLQEITIDHCEYAENDSLAALLGRCPALRSLNIFSCPEVTPEVLINAVKCCPKLKYITYRSSSMLSTPCDWSAEVINRSLESMLRELAPRLRTCSIDALVFR